MEKRCRCEKGQVSREGEHARATVLEPDMLAIISLLETLSGSLLWFRHFRSDAGSFGELDWAQVRRRKKMAVVISLCVGFSASVWFGYHYRRSKRCPKCGKMFPGRNHVMEHLMAPAEQS